MGTRIIEQAEYDQLVKDARFIRVLRRVKEHHTNILTQQPGQTFQATIDPLMKQAPTPEFPKGQDDRNDCIDAFNVWATPGPKA